jgi:hypothetical protein
MSNPILFRGCTLAETMGGDQQSANYLSVFPMGGLPGGATVKGFLDALNSAYRDRSTVDHRVLPQDNEPNTTNGSRKGDPTTALGKVATFDVNIPSFETESNGMTKEVFPNRDLETKMKSRLVDPEKQGDRLYLQALAPTMGRPSNRVTPSVASGSGSADPSLIGFPRPINTELPKHFDRKHPWDDTLANLFWNTHIKKAALPPPLPVEETLYDNVEPCANPPGRPGAYNRPTYTPYFSPAALMGPPTRGPEPMRPYPTGSYVPQPAKQASFLTGFMEQD